MQRLSSLKPFLFNAYYSWLLDNDITPHLLIDATIPKVKVPMDYVKNGNIILSLAPTAIGDFQTLPRGISFKARFKGVAEDIFVPYIAMEQLIALETGSALPIGKALEQLICLLNLKMMISILMKDLIQTVLILNLMKAKITQSQMKSKLMNKRKMLLMLRIVIKQLKSQALALWMNNSCAL